jgi:hypothetical protein
MHRRSNAGGIVLCLMAMEIATGKRLMSAVADVAGIGMLHAIPMMHEAQIGHSDLGRLCVHDSGLRAQACGCRR